MRRTSRVLLLIVTAVLALAGCSSVSGNGRYAGDAAPTKPGAPRADHQGAGPADDLAGVVRRLHLVIRPQVRDSPGGDRPLSFGCGKLRVPLDYRDPPARRSTCS